MTKNILKFAFILLFFIAPVFVTDILAVGMGGGMGMGIPAPCGGPFPPCPIPLDNSVVLLLLAGATYGGIKIFNSIKKNPA